MNPLFLERQRTRTDPTAGMPTHNRMMLGVDLAKAHDYTSLAIIEMIKDTDPATGVKTVSYQLKALDRIRGIEYPVIVDLILKTVKFLETQTTGPICLCLDASGLGAPVRDYLKQSHVFVGSREIFPVVFTGGEAARYDKVSHNYNISKTLIISNFRNLMQRKRIGFAAGLESLPVFLKEIESYEYGSSPSGKTTMNAKEGEHDDMICAVCIPLIIAEWRFANMAKVSANPFNR